MLDKVTIDPVRLEYERIMEFAAGGGNDDTLACMLASWQEGRGAMPDNFGFNADTFVELLAAHFPGLNSDSLCQPGRRVDATRSDEHDDVYRLLLRGRAGHSASEIWMAEIVARSCQGQDHLWQDMGLWSRKQLSELMMRNFPALASLNVRNMKWKKFIYKQLCMTEGIYTCRAPSCEICVDYANCFGPED